MQVDAFVRKLSFKELRLGEDLQVISELVAF